MKKSVLVAMSGGVDSAMAAVILRQKGYNVTGIYFRFFDDMTCSDRAETVSKKTDIELLYIDARECFRKEVMDYFTTMHLKGETPGPCTQCNPNVKWKLLNEQALLGGFDSIATGHYIRLADINNSRRLLKAADKLKDQSYYLWKLQPEILNKSILPLGDYKKSEITKMATKYGLDFLNKAGESAGLCFAGRRQINEILSEKIPKLSERISTGDIIDRKGEIIGKHDGYLFYTIGQKKGLKLCGNRDMFVVQIIAEKNILVVDTWQSLFTKVFTIRDAMFFNNSEIEDGRELQVIIRGFGQNPAGNCRIKKNGTNTWNISLEYPAWAVAPGQPVVFYSGDLLVGGGYATIENYC
jgi:tRNA-specific 2-thiouridylase